MAKEKIIDAVSVPMSSPSQPVTATTCGNIGQQNSTATTLPIKLDAESSAAMAQMMQQMAEQNSVPQYRHINPADVISETGKRMQSVYEQFEALQELGRLLNGKSTAEQLPDSVLLEEITIRFRSKNDAGQVSEPYNAVIKNVACVGDIARLLSTEIGVIILTLQQEISDVAEIAKKADEHYSKMRKAWEEANPDAVIKTAEEVEAERQAAAESAK